MPQVKEYAPTNTGNVVADALANGSGTPQTRIVSPEQAARLCEVVSNPKPPTSALREAMAKSLPFKFVPRSR